MTMLLHDPSPRLRDRIVAHLSSGQALSAQALEKRINNKKARYSIKAIYKELAILVEAGIVLHMKKTYRLSLSWIYDVIGYTDELEKLIENPEFSIDLLPQKGTSKSWHVFSHRQADRLWAQVTSSILATIQEPVVYQGLLHRWWPLLHKDLGRQYRKMMEKKKVKSIMIIAQNDYLDRLFLKLFPPLPSRCIISRTFFRGLPQFFTVCGEYIITTKYPYSFISALDLYFKQVKHEREIAYSDIQNIFGSRQLITQRIEHNPKKASGLVKLFQKQIAEHSK